MNREEKYIHLLTQYGHKINVHCYLYARKDKVLAQDYVQDVLAALWQELDKLHAEAGTIQSWVWVWLIMRRTLSRNRRDSRVKTVPLETLKEEPSVFFPHGEMDEQMLVSLLSEEEQTLWREIQKGYSVGEVAEMMNLSPHTVSQRLYRIKNKLRKEMQNR